jgi:hypothetical protein
MLDPRVVVHGIARCAETPAREVTYRRVSRLVELLHAYPSAALRTHRAGRVRGRQLRQRDDT